MFRLMTFLLMLFTLSFSNPALAEEEYWEYTLRPGDSLWEVARRYTTSVNNWAELEKLNTAPHKAGQNIPPGTRIIIPVSMLKLQPAPAVVIAVSGSARLTRASGEEAVIIVGTRLYSGDRVLTANLQNIRIQFADKSELQVLQNSEVVLDKLSHYKKTGMVDTRVRLNFGSVNTWVEKQSPDSRYEITTPSAITAVRGTAFRLSLDEAEVSRTEVTEGIVGVSVSESTKDVVDGYGIVAEKNKPLPEPVKLLPPPYVSMDHSVDRHVKQFSWQQLSGAKFYRYQVAADEGFNQVVIEDSTTDSRIMLSELTAGEYYLRVRGVDQYKLQGLDSTRSFEVKPAAAGDNNLLWQILTPIGMMLLFLL